MLCIGTFAFISYEFLGYKYSSVLDTVSSESLDDRHRLSKLIYQYENDSNAFVVYDGNDNNVFLTAYIKKQRFGNSYKYKRLVITNMKTPREYDPVVIKVSKNLYYVYVEYEEDIDKIDCMGYTPEGEKIEWQDTTGEKHYCWIYVIDKTKDKE